MNNTREYLNGELEFAVRELRQRVNSLKNDMVTLDEKLERMQQGKKTLISSFGVVQGRGSTIDMLVAQIATLQNCLEALNRE